jgi:hypothetical protein
MTFFRFLRISSFLLLSHLSIGEEITIRTASEKNATAVFQVRVPAGYDASRTELYRVLVLFGGRNTDGKADASGRLGWGEWADREGVFLVCPGFRDDDYWEPVKWSGRALLAALAELRRRYRVCTSHLLYYGYSAGSQASNLFAAWRPRLCRAWVSHACGYFHRPHPGLAGLPGLVTCGDADLDRYAISRRFVAAASRAGERIIWKTFPNRGHEVPPESLALARAFLGFYHRLYASDLAPSPPPPPKGTRRPNPAKPPRVPVAFVGDDLDGTYYPASSKRIRGIRPEDRVLLPSREIAEAWGEAAEGAAP